MDLLDPDSNRPSRSNNADDDWWDRLTADSPLWSSDGALAREHFPIADPGLRQRPSQNTNDDITGVASADSADGGSVRDKRRSSWVLVASLRESAQALALTPLPDDVDICLAEAEGLMSARDRITSALADRVGRVHRAGQAKQHGHASTRSWLRTAAGMNATGAGRLLTLAVELARLPRVREKFAAGDLVAGVVEAICAATAQLGDEDARLAEPILLELAGKAGPAEVAKAGRYLRAVLDPDGEDRDEQADYARRFLRVRQTRDGGLEGEFHLPREPAARLLTLLTIYAKPRAEGDDRPLRVRQADAFIALLEQKIAAELLVLVNAESLPADPEPSDPEPSGPGDEHPEAADSSGAEDTGDCACSDTASAAHACDIADTAGIEDVTPADTGDTGDSGDPGGAGIRSDVGRTDATPAQDEDPCRPDDSEAAEGEAAQPDPPPEDVSARHAHAGHRPGGECRHGRTTHGDHSDVRHGRRRGQSRAQQDVADGQNTVNGQDTRGWGGEARCPSEAPETPGTPRPAPEAPGPSGPAPGPAPRTLLGTAPGLLLATGQMLPVSSVHRLARTSTLVRLVMDADGQVLDMGRKVRLATPVQRRAVFARYATCWVDGCPLPATMCQIDHADNWSGGGLTDLKLLGPACQFHNRDRYRHPDRYTRRRTGTDRWAFTYHRLSGARRPRE